MKHLEYEINLFIDGELPKENEDELFKHLAECVECRRDISKLLLLKEKSKDFIAHEISQLKRKEPKSNIFYKVSFYTGVAASIIILILLLITKPNISLVSKENAVTDSLYSRNKNQNLQYQKSEQRLVAIKGTDQQLYINYIMNLRTEKITDADLLKLDYRSK